MSRRDSKPLRLRDAAARRSDRTRWRIVLFSVALLGASAAARADEILAHGTEEMFWVARVIVPPESAEAGPRTVIRGRGVGSDAQWSDVAQLASRVTSIANRGSQVAALLQPGSWMLLWPGGSSAGAQPPDGALLRMLSSDAESIWAIGSGGREGADAGERSLPAPATAGAATAPAIEAAGAAPATQPHPDGLALYRLNRGRWVRIAPLPHEITAGDVPRASFAVAGQIPMIAVLRFGGTVQTYAYGEPDEPRWLALPPIHAPDAQQIKLLGDGQRGIVWIAPEIGAGRIYIGEPGRWSEPQLLRTQEAIPAGAPRTVALAGNIRLLFIRDGSTFEQTFARDGAPRTDARPLRTTAAAPTDSTPSRVVTLAAAAMLMMVVLSSLRRAGAGTAGPSSMAAHAGLAPAPLLMRFVAGVIDASPLLITCWFVFRDIDPEAQSVDELLRRISFPFYTALAGYLLYTWIAETIFARTIGKALFGLRVVSLEGSRPSATALFVRNALRLVDVTMLAVPLLLVVLSPLRQRVGDIAARTMVVGGRGAAKRPEDRDASST